MKCKAPTVAAIAVAIIFAGHAQAKPADTFAFSGALADALNSNPAMVTGSFSLNEAKGTLSNFSFVTPLGTFTNANSRGSIVMPMSTGPSGAGQSAFEVFIQHSSSAPSGVVLIFAGSPTNFHGGPLLSVAYSGSAGDRDASSLYYTQRPAYFHSDPFASGKAL